MALTAPDYVNDDDNDDHEFLVYYIDFSVYVFSLEWCAMWSLSFIIKSLLCKLKLLGCDSTKIFVNRHCYVMLSNIYLHFARLCKVCEICKNMFTYQLKYLSTPHPLIRSKIYWNKMWKCDGRLTQNSDVKLKKPFWVWEDYFNGYILTKFERCNEAT